MSGVGNSSGGETDTLLMVTPEAAARNVQPSRNGRYKNSMVWNRVFTLGVLALLVVFGVYSERQALRTQTQLASAINRIQTLETVTDQHAAVIERFNSSITNTDVLDQIHSLQEDIFTTTHRLDAELSKTRRDIRAELDETVSLLQTSVQAAELEITNQVDKVKKDMDQYVRTTQDQFSMENSFMIYQLAGTFTVLTCLISMWHMTAHLRKLQQPDAQRKILAILWMSPVYAITSWFSLVFRSAEGYLAIVKDFYEAYTIYQFLSFCIAVLGKGDRNVVVDMLALHVDHLTPPFRLLGCFELCCGCCPAPRYESNRHLADAILLQCQLFAMQFVFLRPLTTTAMVVLQKMNYYGAGTGPMDYRAPQFYLTIVQNVSIFVAFTGLLKFYHAVDKDLAWCRPFAKFMCIKGVVFMTFWQGLALSVLAETTDVGGDDADGFARSSQNFLICLEMLLFSIAHFYCFPTDEWEEGYRVKHASGSFGDSIAFGDFVSDLKLLIKSNGSASGKKLKRKMSSQATIPEENDESSAGNQTDALSVATSIEGFDDSQDMDDRAIVAEALVQSLGALNEDPEIAEAAQRLLDSDVLSPAFFDYSDKADLDMLDVDDTVLKEATKSIHDDGNCSISVYSSYQKPSGDLPDASVNTSLFTSRPEGISPLRPSIFTTVASIAEDERRNGVDH